MSERKVLIITYYWPPSGGSGVQRWLKFVKYLPQYGWKPYVFTPENPSFDLKDESLLKDVPPEAEIVHFPIWEPYSIFNRLSGGNETNANSAPKPTTLFKRISIWIRGNIFIPDPRVFWVRPSAKFLGTYLRKHNIQTLVTTGPPHSVHLIGLRLKKKDPSLNWIADFRDPWSEWGFLDTLNLSSFAKVLHKRMEKKVLQKADNVLTVTPSWVNMFTRLSGRAITLLTNGYDETDFSNITFQRSSKFIIRHVGIVNEQCDPRPFMLALQSLCQTNAAFRDAVQIEFMGTVHEGFKDFVAATIFLKSKTRFIGQMPHSQVLSSYGSASLLLLVLTGYKEPESYLPGKLFEYMATGLPILGIGPTRGDAAFVLADTKAGKMVEADDSEGIKRALTDVFSDWQLEEKQVPNPNKSIYQYSRRQLTKELVKFL